jgi:hypothetical protein
VVSDNLAHEARLVCSTVTSVYTALKLLVLNTLVQSEVTSHNPNSVTRLALKEVAFALQPFEDVLLVIRIVKIEGVKRFRWPYIVAIVI